MRGDGGPEIFESPPARPRFRAGKIRRHRRDGFVAGTEARRREGPLSQGPFAGCRWGPEAFAADERKEIRMENGLQPFRTGVEPATVCSQNRCSTSELPEYSKPMGGTSPGNLRGRATLESV